MRAEPSTPSQPQIIVQHTALNTGTQAQPGGGTPPQEAAQGQNAIGAGQPPSKPQRLRIIYRMNYELLHPIDREDIKNTQQLVEA